VARPRVRWLTGHLVHHPWHGLARLLVTAAALDTAAAVGLAYLAGFAGVREALARVSWPWLVAAVGGLVVSFVGYFLAYRGIFAIANGPRLRNRELGAVVIGGFGGFLAHGGSALDVYALRAAGADERDARVRVSTLAGMEQGVMAVLGTGAAITILVQGLREPAGDLTIPWAVIPIPGFAIAFWLAARYRGRWRERTGWRGTVGIFLDSIDIDRRLFLHPHRHDRAMLGMAVFWLGDAFAVWAALSAFGYRMSVAALFVGFATGMVFTRRIGPLAAAGILMLVLPVTLWHSGAPLATAIVAVFAHRVLVLWLSTPFALGGRPMLRKMGSSDAGPAEIRG
jgi:uncharacterized membrane protein YbhN (UPF0104 family)